MITKQNKGVAKIIVNTIVLATPLLFLYLPQNYFDEGKSICPSKLLLDFECPGCGITRAVQHAIHFDFKTAWSFNKLYVIIIPIAIYYWFRLFFLTINQIKSIKNKS